MNPPEQGHVVNLDAAFSEQFFQIPVGQSVTQVPTNGDQDDLWREPESCECLLGRLDGVGAENPVRPGHAAVNRYSWIRPKTAPLRRNSAGSGSPIGGGESMVSGAS